MSREQSTDLDPRPRNADDPAILALDRFLSRLRAGLAPRIEDYLDGLDASSRTMLLRELITAERDWKREHDIGVDSANYRARFPEEARLIDEVLGDAPTVSMAQRDRTETQVSVLFGLLSLANGLIAPETLTRVLDAWADAPGRPLREMLVERGYLAEADAWMVAALTSKHLEQHYGSAAESLAALGHVIRFRFNPAEIVDSELRAILAGCAADAANSRASNGWELGGFSPRYEVVKQHAKGGLGVVSLARDREIHREVAVKEIRPDCADNPDYRARFLREAEVTGRLEHPGIVPVYGMGYHDDGRPYYIMRFIRGETLKVAIGRLHKPGNDGEETGTVERPDLHTLVGRFIDACHAVAYAHYRKILHRDIKPINIMLGPFGETLVVDWGLAKSFDAPRSDEYDIEEGSLRPESGSGMTPTRVGSQVGTTGYMSPEQAAGRLSELGPTSDIFSLGITLHNLVTGHPPFEGAGKEEFLRRVLEGDFPRPTKVNPSVPLTLEAICLKAMALRPIDRYQSVTELVNDLENWRAGNPVQAYPEPPLDRLARWARKHKTALAGAAVLMVCTTVGLAAYATRERDVAARERLQKERAVLLQASAEKATKHARDSLRMTLKELSGSEFSYLPNSGPARLKLATKVLERYWALKSEHPNDQEVRSEVAHAAWIIANINRSMGEFDQGLRRYYESMRLLESPIAGGHGSDEDRLLLATVRIDLGEHLRLAGRPKEAGLWYRKALDLLAEPDFPTHAEVCPRIEASALIDLAACWVETSQPEDALAQAMKAVEILTTLSDKSQPNDKNRLLLIYALNTRSTAFLNAGEREPARKDLSEALKRAQKLLGNSDNKANTDYRYALAMTRNEFGRFLSKVGEHAEAASQFNAALEVIETLWRENLRVPYMEAEMAAALNGRASARLALLANKPDDEALKLAKKDCLKARTNLDDMLFRWRDHYAYWGLLGQTVANLGRITLAQGDRTDAKKLLEEAFVYHGRAIELNSATPDDTSLRDAVRHEIEALEEPKDTPASGR